MKFVRARGRVNRDLGDAMTSLCALHTSSLPNTVFNTSDEPFEPFKYYMWEMSCIFADGTERLTCETRIDQTMVSLEYGMPYIFQGICKTMSRSTD